MEATPWKTLRVRAGWRPPAAAAWLLTGLVLLGMAPLALPGTAAHADGPLSGQRSGFLSGRPPVSFSLPGEMASEPSVGTTLRQGRGRPLSNDLPVRFSGMSQPPAPPAAEPPAPASDAPAGESNSNSGSNGAAATQDGAPRQLGEAPQETRTQLQFLGDDSILLDPGESQFEVTLQYQMDDSDFVFARIQGNTLQVAEAKARQRLLVMPLEWRYGFSPVTQFFVNVPFGWSNSEVSFLDVDDFSNVGGIGDVNAGFTQQLVDGDQWCPDVLATFSFSAPTGNSSFASSLATPGANLGEGVWSITGALTCIKTYDPVVLFYGLGYRHRFDGEFDNPFSDVDFQVNPGSQIFYRCGIGFAVNPQVTLSASFLGQYIAEPEVDGVRLAGAIREPMQVRLAATFVRSRPADCEPRFPRGAKFIEPFVNFGLTDAAIDSIIGVSVTY